MAILKVLKIILNSFTTSLSEPFDLPYILPGANP